MSLTNPSGLATFKTAWDARTTSPVSIWAIGDSITEGYYADSLATHWPQVMASVLRSPDGLPSTYGYVPLYQPINSIWTSSGTITDTDDEFGIGRRSSKFSATAYRQATQTCDRVQVVYAKTPGAGTFKVTIDGVDKVTLDCAGASMGGYVWTSDALSEASHTVKITGVSGTSYVEGVFFHRQSYDDGLQVWSGGHANATTYYFTQQIFAGAHTDGAYGLATTGTGENYFLVETLDDDLNGATELDIRMFVYMADWTPASDQTYLSFWNESGNHRGFEWGCDTSGTMWFKTSTDGSAVTTATASATSTSTNGLGSWRRITWRSSDGRVQFFRGAVGTAGTAAGSVTWTQVGTDRTADAATLHNHSSMKVVGGASLNGSGAAQRNMDCTIGQVWIETTIGGSTPVFWSGYMQNEDPYLTSGTSTTGPNWTSASTYRVFTCTDLASNAPPDLLIYCLGTNDVFWGFSAGTIQTYMEMYLDSVMAKSATDPSVLLMLMPKNEFGANTNVATAMAAIASERGYAYFQPETYMGNYDAADDPYYYEGVHPNDDGLQALGNLVAAELLGYVQTNDGVPSLVDYFKASNEAEPTLRSHHIAQGLRTHAAQLAAYRAKTGITSGSTRADIMYEYWQNRPSYAALGS